MGWLRLVGSLKLQVSFAKEPYKRDNILQKRPIIIRSLLMVANPYHSLARSGGYGVCVCVCVGVEQLFLQRGVLQTNLCVCVYYNVCIRRTPLREKPKLWRGNIRSFL